MCDTLWYHYSTKFHLDRSWSPSTLLIDLDSNAPIEKVASKENRILNLDLKVMGKMTQIKVVPNVNQVPNFWCKNHMCYSCTQISFIVILQLASRTNDFSYRKLMRNLFYKI